jgi:hypothetical protein
LPPNRHFEQGRETMIPKQCFGFKASLKSFKHAQRPDDF